MSQKSDLPNDAATVKKWLETVTASGYVNRVLVHGSRSPKRKHKPRPESDWDLIILTNNDKVSFPHPRRFKIFHGDVITMLEDKASENLLNMCQEIWPEDKYDILVNGGFIDADK